MTYLHFAMHADYAHVLIPNSPAIARRVQLCASLSTISTQEGYQDKGKCVLCRSSSSRPPSKHCPFRNFNELQDKDKDDAVFLGYEEDAICFLKSFFMSRCIYHVHSGVGSPERLEGFVCQRRQARPRNSFCWLSNPPTSQIRGLGTESTHIDRRKASMVDTDTIGMEPVITRFAKKVSQVASAQFLTTYHRIIKPSLSELPQTHRVVPLFVLEGVVPPSGSVIVVGDILAEDP